jgi:hypothetical protein
MHMQIDQARTHNLTAAIDGFSIRRCLKARAHCLNFSVAKEDIRGLVAVIGGINHTPTLQEHKTHRPTAYPLID